MKTIQLASIIFALALTAHAETTLQDDPPRGFIHLQNETETELNDVFIREDQIVSIVVSGPPDGVTPWGRITISTAEIERISGSNASKSTQYVLRFGSRGEAMEAAKRLLPN